MLFFKETSDVEKINNLVIRYKGEKTSVIEALENSKESRLFSKIIKKNHSLKELQHLARSSNIRGYSKLTKSRLLRLLKTSTQLQI